MKNSRDSLLLKRVISHKFQEMNDFFMVQSFFTIKDYEYIKTNEDKLPIHILFRIMNFCNVSLDMVMNFGFEVEYPSLLYAKVYMLNAEYPEKQYLKRMFFEYSPYYSEYETIQILFYYLSSYSKSKNDVTSFFKVISRYITQNNKRFSPRNIKYISGYLVGISTFDEVKEWYFHVLSFLENDIDISAAKKYAITLANLISRSMFLVRLSKEDILILKKIFATYLMHIGKYKLYNETYFFALFVHTFNYMITTVPKFQNMNEIDINISVEDAFRISFTESTTHSEVLPSLRTALDDIDIIYNEKIS